MLSRLPALALAERAQQAAAKGQHLIPGNGVPVLTMPEHVQTAAANAASQTFDRHSRGHRDLREAIARQLEDDLQVTADPDHELLITHGAQHAFSLAFRALLNAGDEVVVPAPTYFFDGALRLAGARPVYVPTDPATGWHLDIGRMEAAVTDRTTAIVLCNPNNPTGNAPTPDELRHVIELAAGRGLFIITDESYSRYVHGENKYTPQMHMVDTWPRMVTVTSLSKNYAFTSWRVGYVHAPRPLLESVHRALEWDSINVGDVPQAAATAALTGPQEWISEPLAAYRGKRDLLAAEIRGAGLEVVDPDAGAFMSVDCQRLNSTGRDLEDRLLQVGLVALCLDAFHGPNSFARFLFGAGEQDLRATGAALQELTGTTATTRSAPR